MSTDGSLTVMVAITIAPMSPSKTHRGRRVGDDLDKAVSRIANMRALLPSRGLVENLLVISGGGSQPTGPRPAHTTRSLRIALLHRRVRGSVGELPFSSGIRLATL
jgi:hypothetical protein